ncbi:Gfo/Idh/MocA family protein [Quadrisphaera sp. INWT6]|uniref:Gfo/Idh/MocA family protein n=1 Tax=Quadrisphaera sp. INWT6 TaxID=2596917 RepID=UPI0018925733|nr:Gfo/Idh/MocA family oxidoreductase [Quadrisphaera sp. INWT6]MBF5082989.1 Gfo/Idh/MocA family oxidoreductase [Quadrisphaera sp. INWT6]
MSDTGVLRVGVVGLGWAGQQHLEAFAALDGVEVVALAGMEAEQLAALADAHGIPHRSARWEDLLDVEGLDAVSIAVPTFLHAPIAVAALGRGLHVLSEKPMARDGAEASTMVDAARAAGRVLEVVFNHRQRGDVQALRQLVSSGELGRPYSARTWWLRRQGIPTLGSWFTNAAASGGGPLVDIGVHALDWALHVLGEPRVVAVSAATASELGPQGRGGAVGARKTLAGEASAYEVEDLASAFLRLEGGGLLQLETSWAVYRDPADEIGMTVRGTDGGAELVATGNPDPVGDLRVFTEAGDRDVVAEPGLGHRAVVEQFVDVVRGGPQVWKDHDGTLALERARIIDACYLSAREGREVAL